MSYKLRDEGPGYHHIWCRGNNKRTIVLDDVDRRSLIGLVDHVAHTFGWRIAAYCLMDNHYHLVMSIDERGMSEGFCRLNTAHATEFNRRHGRVNHLFGRRYGSAFVPNQDALLWACRYVVRNPIRAGLVERAEDYEWSSYRATLQLSPPAIELATEELLAAFHQADPDDPRARERFAAFVHTPTPAEKQAAASVTAA